MSALEGQRMILQGWALPQELLHSQRGWLSRQQLQWWGFLRVQNPVGHLSQEWWSVVRSQRYFSLLRTFSAGFHTHCGRDWLQNHLFLTLIFYLLFLSEVLWSSKDHVVLSLQQTGPEKGLCMTLGGRTSADFLDQTVILKRIVE